MKRRVTSAESLASVCQPGPDRLRPCAEQPGQQRVRQRGIRRACAADSVARAAALRASRSCSVGESLTRSCPSRSCPYSSGVPVFVARGAVRCDTRPGVVDDLESLLHPRTRRGCRSVTNHQDRACGVVKNRVIVRPDKARQLPGIDAARDQQGNRLVASV